MTDFRLTDETYERIMCLLDEEMTRGLSAQSHQISTVRMFPTYVRSVPDGTGRASASIQYDPFHRNKDKHVQVTSALYIWGVLKKEVITLKSGHRKILQNEFFQPIIFFIQRYQCLQ